MKKKAIDALGKLCPPEPPKYDITDILVRESGVFCKDLYKPMFAQSPWTSLVSKGKFPKNMGKTK